MLVKERVKVYTVKLTIVGVYEVVFNGWRIVVFVTVAFSRCVRYGCDLGWLTGSLRHHHHRHRMASLPPLCSVRRRSLVSLLAAIPIHTVGDLLELWSWPGPNAEGTRFIISASARLRETHLIFRLF